MAIPTFTEGPSLGTYGESRFGDRLRYLQNLQKSLDAGEISFDDFWKTAAPLASEARLVGAQIGGRGSAAAKAIGDVDSQLAQAGFKFSGAPGDEKLLPSSSLQNKYQTQIRESLLPKGLTPEQKASYLNDIPEDIAFGSDQYNVEKEGLRQKLQSEQTAATQKTQRAAQLTDLASLLSKNADTNFQRSIPQVAESANTAGIFRSTGYGNALAEQQAQLQEDVASQVSRQGLSDRAADTGSLADILAASQAFQSSGLQRKFSLDDFANQAKYAQEIAMKNQAIPSGGSKTSGAAQGAAAGASAGTAILPGWGTAIGAGVGAIGGGQAAKSKA